MTSKYTKEDLKKRCDKLLLPVSGTKEQLLERLGLYNSISTLSKEKLFIKAKKNGIDLRKSDLKELRAEYCKKKLGPISPPVLATPTPGFVPLLSSEKTKVEAVVNVFPSPPVHSVHSSHLDDLLSRLKAENEDLKREKKECNDAKANAEKIFTDRLASTLKSKDILDSEAKFLRDKIGLLESQIATLKEEKVDLSILNDSLRQEVSKKKLYAESLEDQRKVFIETLNASKSDLEDSLEKSKNLEHRVTELEESIKVKDRVLAETLEEMLKKSQKIVSLKKSIINTQTDPK